MFFSRMDFYFFFSLPAHPDEFYDSPNKFCVSAFNPKAPVFVFAFKPPHPNALPLLFSSWLLLSACDGLIQFVICSAISRG